MPQITGLVDINPDRARALARDHEIAAPIWDDLDSALAEGPLPDMAIVATYTNTHLALSEALIRRGVDVYLEKPLASTLDDTRRIIALDEDPAVPGRIQVGLQFRHSPLYERVTEMIAAGRIGEVRYIAARELRGDWVKFYPDDPEAEQRLNWRYFSETLGNSILAKLCHDLDILCHACGVTPTHVSAHGGRAVFTDRETHDHAALRINCENGAILTLDFSLFAPEVQNDTIIMGSEGMLKFRRGGEEISYWSGVEPHAEPTEVIDTNSQGLNRNGYLGTSQGLTAFFDAATNGTVFYPTPRDAWPSSALCFAAHASTLDNANVRSLTDSTYRLENS